MKITEFLTNNADNPIAVSKNPYFSWKMESEVSATKQKSYRLIVENENKEVFMDSGVVESDRSSYISYIGKPLQSRGTYIVKLQLKDSNEQTAETVSRFETALLEHDDFCAKWIAEKKKRKANKAGFKKQGPSTLFRQTFLAEKPIKKARLYATAHGAYEVYINGKRPDDRYLAPEHTVYEKYLCYQTYDVTKLLEEGKNCIGMHVGDGWYFCKNTKPNSRIDLRHAVLYQLEIVYEDGTLNTVISDESAQIAQGPIQSSDLFAGEAFDARKVICDWNKADDPQGQWSPVLVRKYPTCNLKPQQDEGITIKKKVTVSKLLRSPKGETILDFGQNMAGFVRVKTALKAGQTLKLEFSEVLDKDGNYYNNIMSVGNVGAGCDQTDEFVSDGEPFVYSPHFTYHGFRYARVTIDGKAFDDLDPNDFTALLLSSKKKQTGSFSCSNEDLNRLYENISWSQFSNMISIPTDCPQREKAGWTGDMLVYAKTAMQNEDCTLMLSRWLENMEMEQDEYGIIPMVVPECGSYPLSGKITSLTAGVQGKGTSSGWGDAAVAVPYAMYEISGNTFILKQQYECMRRWCDYIIMQAETKRPKNSNLDNEIEKYLWDTGYHYGEWLIPSQSKNGLDMKNLKQIMAQSSCYTAPIFGWNSVNTFAEIAEILSTENENSALYKTDKIKYKAVAEAMKNAIQKGVIRPDGSMPSDLMGAYVLPISFDLVPEEHRRKFADNLVKKIEENGMKMDTGFLGTPYLLDALCKIGRKDLAYKLLLQDEIPSWLSEVRQGATTIWENCFGYDENGNPGTMSFNHYSFGCVADWMFRNIGGIVPLDAGYRTIEVTLPFDAPLKWAKRSFETVNGTVSVSWEKDDSSYRMDVSIPCNCTARVALPGEQVIQIGNGEYHYEGKLSL